MTNRDKLIVDFIKSKGDQGVTIDEVKEEFFKELNPSSANTVANRRLKKLVSDGFLKSVSGFQVKTKYFYIGEE